jgi:hypothetical protein
VRAREEYRAVLELNTKSRDPARQAAVKRDAEAAIAKLDARIPTIVAAVVPNNARVSVDGGAPVAAGQPSPVDPGSHTLEVEADGFVTMERKVEVTESQRLVLDLTLSQQLAVPTPPGEEKNTLLLPGLLIGGLGLALAGTGAGLLGVAAGKADEIRSLCGEDAEPPHCEGSAADAATATELSDEGRRFEISGGVLVALGGMLLVSSAATLIGDAARSEEPVKAAVFPILGPTEVGCSVVLTF